MNSEVRRSVYAILADLPARGPDGEWTEELTRAAFDRLHESGWTRVGLAESLGGSGGELVDVAHVVAGCALSGHLLPMADSMIAGRLIQLAQLEIPDDCTCALPLPEPALTATGMLDVEAARVPWGRFASHYIVVSSIDGEAVVNVVDAFQAVVSPGANLADEPRDAVLLSAVRPRASRPTGLPLDTVVSQLRLSGALVRAIQISAACTAILDLTTRYCADRRQFGQPIRSFQAVQQQLAALAGDSAMAEAAVSHALSLVPSESAHLPVAPVATAKVQTSVAAGEVARIGHQLHGAIGITREYPLHQSTRALWAWREEYGSKRYWAYVLLDTLVTEHGGTDTWPRMAGLLPADGCRL